MKQNDIPKIPSKIGYDKSKRYKYIEGPTQQQGGHYVDTQTDTVLTKKQVENLLNGLNPNYSGPEPVLKAGDIVVTKLPDGTLSYSKGNEDDSK